MSNKVRIGFSIKGYFQMPHLIEPIIKLLTKDKFEIYIFHVNHYYDFILIEPEYDNVTFVDLYSKSNVSKKLRMLNLDWMVILNPGQIYDFFISQLCKNYGIKTIYYQHGLSLDFGSFNINDIRQGKKISDSILSLKRYIFFYKSIFISLINANNKVKLSKLVLKRSKQVLFNFGNANYPKYGLKQAHCDFGIVYGAKDKGYLMEKNGYIESQIIVGGYPMQELELVNDLPTNYILYISSGLVTSNVIPISIEDERKNYEKLAEIVNSSGYELVVKLHPTEDEELFKSYFIKNNMVHIYKKSNLASLARNSKIVIGDYSTALFYPIKYLKPIILLQNEFFKKYPFDYYDYDIGVKATIDELRNCIQSNINVDKLAYESFSNNYISGLGGLTSHVACVNLLNKEYNI